ELEPWCMTLASAARAITPRTRVLLPVHLYGHPANMVAVNQLARAHGLSVLEDAAPALGAEVNCRKVGGLARVGVFSFQGAKLLVTGEGGMLVTDDADPFEPVSPLADHGRDSDRPFHIPCIGYKYKLSNLQAALGLAQLERVEELVEKKRLIFDWYQQRLGRVPGIVLNAEKHWARATYWMTSVVLAE